MRKLYPQLLLLGCLFGWSVFSLSTGCSSPPTDTDAPSADASSESPVADATEPALPDKTTPEPATPEPQPEPAPVDTGPVVPEKVLIDNIPVTIVHVTDGDTLYVVKKPGGWASRIRLKGVSAPECFKKNSSDGFQVCSTDDEYYGVASYEALKVLALGDFRKAQLHCKQVGNECEQDDFGRYLAYIVLADKRDLGLELIRGGGAFTFTRYENEKVADYCRAEADAIRETKGIWSKGRAFVRQNMNSNTKSWYDNRNTSQSHDTICSQAMGESFAKRAGE